jgi:hypothetical protein
VTAWAKLTFAERLDFPGGKVTGHALWQAALPDHLRAMENRPNWKQSIALMDESLKDFTGAATTSKTCTMVLVTTYTILAPDTLGFAFRERQMGSGSFLCPGYGC